MRNALCVLLLAACGGAPSRALTPPHTPPTSRDVMLALTAHATLIPADASCAGVTGDLHDEALGTIEAHLLAQLEEAQAEGESARASASCEAGPPWPCTFEVSVESEDPWRYAIAFRLDAQGAIDPASVRCPGGS